jgi:hypothetical protein
MFSHEIVINVLIVKELMKTGEECQEYEKDMTKKEGQYF